MISHKEPVTCCMYNPSFKQVVTCSESSVSTCIYILYIFVILCPFYTPPHDSSRVLWFHFGRPCVHRSVRPLGICIWFPDDNLSTHQWIFTKLGMCIDIMTSFSLRKKVAKNSCSTDNSTRCFMATALNYPTLMSLFTTGGITRFTCMGNYFSLITLVPCTAKYSLKNFIF